MGLTRLHNEKRIKDTFTDNNIKRQKLFNGYPVTLTISVLCMITSSLDVKKYVILGARMPVATPAYKICHLILSGAVARQGLPRYVSVCSEINSEQDFKR